MANRAESIFLMDRSLELASGTGVYEWNAAEDRLVWSPGLLRIYGLTEAPECEAGFTSLVHPDDRVRVEADTAGFLGSSADTYSHEFRIVRPDGTVRFVLDRGVIERDGEGRVRTIRGMNVDVSEFRQVQERVNAATDIAAEQFAELEALYAEAPLGLAMLDRELRFVRINRALAEINGYSVEEHLGRRVWDLLPDLRQSAEATLRSVLDTGSPVRNVVISGETSARPGQMREWREHFFPVRGAGGAVQGIGIICEEITDSVAMERSRAEIEARLAAALKAGNLGVHEFDPRSGAIIWDSTTRQIWGVSAEEQVTYDMFVAGLHPDDLADVQAAIAAALDCEGPGRYDAVYRVIDRQSRDMRWVRADGAATFEGRTATRLVGTVKDITGERRVEAALRESEARFRNMADDAPVMVWVTEADGSCTYLNNYWYEFTGQTAEDALGFGWLAAVHPDDAVRSERVFREAIERNEAFRINYRLRRADGVYRWAVDSARPRIGDGGEFLGFTGSVIDVQDLKDAELKLLAARDTFQQLVDRSPFGIYAVDSDFRLAQVSDGAQKVFENVRPLIGRDFAEVLRSIWPEPFASDAIARFRHTLATGEPYHAPGTVERRADIGATEAYDWKLERITMPDGRPGVVCHFYDLSERQAFEDKIQYLMREMNHRAKNLLALVDAVARQTASVGRDGFLERFSERLGAMAASQELLVRTEWDGADLAALVEAQLLPFKDLIGQRILLDGPAIQISSAPAQALGMALHELATNAAKYGALSDDTGRVEISWRIDEQDGSLFSMSWNEKDGPRVKMPTRSGFGERVAKRMVEAALSGEVVLDYAENGFCWSLRCPFSQVGGTV